MGLFAPEKQFSSVAAIDAEWDLLRLHLTHVLLDLDNTLRRRDNDEVPLEVRAWLTHVQQKGIKPCILSNNFHENVFAVARELDMKLPRQNVVNQKNQQDRKSTRLNSSHKVQSRMPSSA